MTATLLQAERLGHDYGERRALDGVSFTASAGEALGFLGPNGAGKSTLFHILCGLIEPREGALHLETRKVAVDDPELRRQMGVVFQDPSLDGKLTVRENLELFAAMHLLPRAQARERIDRLLGLVELSGRAGDSVEKLSGGMKRRVELVRALLPSPRILLLDEPTSGVDLAGFRAWWRWLDELRAKEGLCVLLTTHRADEAERCTRVVILDEGRLVAQGRPDELTARVGDDVIRLRAPDSRQLVDALQDRLSLAARLDGDDVVVHAPRGHELIPRIVEGLTGSVVLQSVELRRPGIAEAFLKLTGHSLVDGTRAGRAA